MRTTNAALLISLSICTAMAAAVAAQQRPQTPPLPPSTGTAQISGTIVTDEATPRPVRRAVVSLTMASISIGRSTTTDDAGRFVFTQLPAGNYSPPRATKAGYVSTTYGEKRVYGMGAPITLTEGQRLTIALKMIRGAVITGAIVDQGRPAQYVSVQATAVRTVNGAHVASDAYYYDGSGSATTDDRGIYRMYGLPPGDYLVSVAGRTLIGSAAVRPITDAEMQWAQQQLQGGSAGSSASASVPSSPPPPAQAVASAPVYYPGTTVASQAVPITLTAGQERSGVDFTLQVVPTSRVEGTVIGLDGRPAATAQINLVPRVLDSGASQLDSLMLIDSMMLSRPAVVDGKFAIAAVKPGDYTIAARGTSRSDTPAPSGPGAGGPAPAMPLWASADISVNGADVTDIVLRLAPGIDVAGRVSFDGTAEKPADLSTVTVRLRSAPTPGVTVAVSVPSAPVNADGTFTLKGVTPGRYLVYSSVPGPARTPVWTMKSARVGEIDAADVPFEVSAGRETSDIAITFTDKMGELSGRLLDGANNPTSQLSIILFPTDKAMWSQTSRRIRSPVRPANDGVFKFTGLLAGDYFLAALTDFDMTDVYKPEFLEAVSAAAMKITIGEGEKKVQDLRISGGQK